MGTLRDMNEWLWRRRISLHRSLFRRPWKGRNFTADLGERRNFVLSGDLFFFGAWNDVQKKALEMRNSLHRNPVEGHGCGFVHRGL
jgi:hypothetical protein